MKTNVFKTQELAAKHIAATIKEIVQNKPTALLCLAAGHTSLPVFDELISMNQSGEIDFSQVSIVGLDEWLNISKEAYGSCAYFLNDNIFSKINVSPENIRLFDGMCADPAKECESVELFIKGLGGIDYLLLGMGMNGHLALNEPGCSFETGAHVTDLAPKTKEVAVKYFEGDMPPIEQGITLGIQNMLDASVVQLSVFGAHKKEIVAKLLNLDPTPDLPATALKVLPGCELILDEAASN